MKWLGTMSRVSPNHSTERPGEDLALVRDRRRVDGVVGGDAVGGDHQQVAAQVVELADLARMQERERDVTCLQATSQVVREIGQDLVAVLGDHARGPPGGSRRTRGDSSRARP